jgi:hypothetical protein
MARYASWIFSFLIIITFTLFTFLVYNYCHGRDYGKSNKSIKQSCNQMLHAYLYEMTMFSYS